MYNINYMDGYDAYQYSLAVKMHFTQPGYDAFKYNFKTRANQKSYWGRPDKYQLTKIGKRFKNRREIIQYFAAHHVQGNTWVGDMIRDEETYRKFLGRMDSLSYNFKNELEELSEYKLDELLTTKDSSYPIIIKRYLEDSVSLETVCILNSLTSFIEDANKNISETILWPDIYNRIVKFEPFIDFDNDKFIKIVFSIFKS